MKISEETLAKYEELRNLSEAKRELETAKRLHKKKLRKWFRRDVSSVDDLKRKYGKVDAYNDKILEDNENIALLRNQHNQLWNALAYEEKVRYRYWINGESYPNDPTESVKKPTDKTVTYYKIDRANAKKLCDRLIEFLETDKEWFKVGLDENHAG